MYPRGAGHRPSSRLSMGKPAGVPEGVPVDNLVTPSRFAMKIIAREGKKRFFKGRSRGLCRPDNAINTTNCILSATKTIAMNPDL